MKKIFVMLLLFIPMPVLAQNYQGMGEGNMEMMMQNMEKMQECMDNVDEAEMEKIQQRAEEMDAEIRSLCQAGKRQAAQSKAVAFGKEMSKNPSVKHMQKCSKMMEGFMPQNPYMDPDRDYSKQHVCDM